MTHASGLDVQLQLLLLLFLTLTLDETPGAHAGGVIWQPVLNMTYDC